MPAIPSALTKYLAPYPVVTMQPVQWGELDIAHHVNNTVHARWAETGRIAYYQEFDPETFGKGTPDSGPILAKLQIRYFAPVFFPDNIWIGTKVIDLQEERFAMETILVSENRIQTCAKARAEMVNYDFRSLRKAAMPTDFAERVQAFESARLSD